MNAWVATETSKDSPAVYGYCLVPPGVDPEEWVKEWEAEFAAPYAQKLSLVGCELGGWFRDPAEVSNERLPFRVAGKQLYRVMKIGDHLVIKDLNVFATVEDFFEAVSVFQRKVITLHILDSKLTLAFAVGVSDPMSALLYAVRDFYQGLAGRKAKLSAGHVKKVKREETEEYKAIVKEVRRMMALNMYSPKIAECLNEKGFRTPTGQEWIDVRVRELIRKIKKQDEPERLKKVLDIMKGN